MSVATTNSTAPFPGVPASSTAAPALPPPPPELEQTLALLSAHRTVLGYLLLSAGHPVSIIRHSGVVFDGEQGRRYASAIGNIVESVRSGLQEVAGENNDVDDDLRFMRIRTRRHEIMISPDNHYLLAVLHDPTIT